ncbi:hypothetical protein CAEBREN_03164 [Caenorhabditis brenneri]|uniref:Uncharacterized protein n=1 Tax=Caenorhabditis brenneri TaxID=135651 RepID=G0MMR9_CAEBE|nr:hypothetical protein CAEBREN_03164 [Caenorhabditis brenneri]
MDQRIINGNKKVRAATQEMLDILAEERAKKKCAKYTEASTNTETNQGASSVKEGPGRANAPKFNMDSILAEKQQDGPAGLEMKNGPETAQGDLPEWAAQLFALHAEQLLPSTATGTFPPTTLVSSNSITTSRFSFPDILNLGINSGLNSTTDSSSIVHKAFPTTSSRKRAADSELTPSETCSKTSTKKFAQAATSAKSPEMVVSTPGALTTWNSEQFNAFYQYYQQLPGSAQGLLNTLPQTRGAPSQDALTAFQTDNQHFADSVLGLNSGQSAPSWNGGTGALSGSTQRLGLSQLLQMGLFGNVPAATTPSTSQQSSSSSGGPQANTAVSDGDTEGY